MISIGVPYIETDSRYAYLKAKITITQDTAENWMNCRKKLPKTHWRFYEDYPPKAWENQGELYFLVEKEYQEYLCTDRADAFLVAFLYYAMLTGSDILSEAPISEKLLFGINHHLFPALLIEDKGYKKIKIIAAPKKEPYLSENAVATGMSCGVDSLYSLKKYNSEDIPEQYRLTHLTYFNMGAIFHPNTAENKHYSINEFYDITGKMSQEKRQNAQMVAEKVNMPLVYVESNLDKDYYRGAYGYTGVYRNCSMVLALQGLFGKYYCSSAGWPNFFDLSLDEGSEHYETLLCSAFSNGTVQFILSDFVTRYEKTLFLANYDIAHKFLDVCFNFNNCGKCQKCLRTLVTFDLLDCLEDFSNVFDIDYFKKHRVEAYAWLIETSKGQDLDDNVIFAKDLFDRAKNKEIIPKESFDKYRKVLFVKKIHTYIRVAKGIIKRILMK